MSVNPSAAVERPKFVGNDKVLFGIVFGVLAFWLFAQTPLNIAPVMAGDLGIETNVMNIAVSITALFSGTFIVVMGGLADRLGLRGVVWRADGAKRRLALDFLRLRRAVAAGHADGTWHARKQSGRTRRQVRSSRRRHVYGDDGRDASAGDARRQSRLDKSCLFDVSCRQRHFRLAVRFDRTAVANAFINFKLFKNMTFTGATVSNFLLNGTVGIFIVACRSSRRQAVCPPSKPTSRRSATPSPSWRSSGSVKSCCSGSARASR